MNDHAQIPTCGNKLCVCPTHIVCGDEARFWDNVVKFAEQDGRCWMWVGARDKDMYGIHNIHQDGKILSMRATHYSIFLHTGAMPGDLFACHHCDHPWCVNPRHLFLGTAKDNAEDMMKKDRGRSPLTNEIVKEIIALAPTTTHGDLAVKYGVSHSCITGIVNSRRWKHIKR